MIMTIDEYRCTYQNGPEVSAPGWEAIDRPLKAIYGDQEPRHWGTLISHAIGGPDPLDGVSAYESTAGGIPHLHFVTYGYSSLYYDEESVGEEFSKYGFEMTFRLKGDYPDDDGPLWVVVLMQKLARYVFQSGNHFEEFHWVPANGPIYLKSDTKLVGLVFSRDPELATMETSHGRVEFLQAFGITQRELDGLKNGTLTSEELLERHLETNPLLITDLVRKEADHPSIG